MYANYDKKIRNYLREIIDIAEANMPNGKYLQIVNRAGKITAAMHRADRRSAKGTGYEEEVSPEITHDEVVAACEKMAKDKVTVLAWLHEGPVDTVRCIEANILRASDVIYRLRKDGWPIKTRLVKSGRARIAEYTLTGPQQSRETGFAGFEN